jgi:hypothetical protein
MSGGMGESMCPLCDGRMITSFETRPHEFMSGVCLECGYCYWTESGIAPLDTVNAEREDQDLEPLIKLTIDLKALDQLRKEHGLEPLKEVTENWKETLDRIEKEVDSTDVIDMK